MKEIQEIAKIILCLKDKEETAAFLTELLTQTEISTLSKRWRILKMLSSGSTQREISKELQVSLCKVTRGAKVLKNKNSVITKYLRKD